MYPEFIAIYVGLGVIAALLIVVIGFLIALMKKVSGGNYYVDKSVNTAANNKSQPTSGGVVFCMNCSNQFPANQNSCPQCGTARNN